jgi:hypothetical protein
MFPYRNVHKYTWTSPDGNTHNQIDHILIDSQRHLSVLDVRSFRAADCDTDHYLVGAELRGRLAVNKQGSHKFHTERRMMSSGMLRRMALVITDVSEELNAFFIRVTGIGELGTMLLVNSNRRTMQRNTKYWYWYFFAACVCC